MKYFDCAKSNPKNTFSTVFLNQNQKILSALCFKILLSTDPALDVIEHNIKQPLKFQNTSENTSKNVQSVKSDHLIPNKTVFAEKCLRF